MTKPNLALLGAMVVSDAISFDQANAWIEFCTHVDVQCVTPISLEAAVDLALDYFHEDPDTEASKEQAKVAASHDAPSGHCCECGEPLALEDAITDLDCEMSMDAWIFIRDLVRLRDHIELEEC